MSTAPDVLTREVLDDTAKRYLMEMLALRIARSATILLSFGLAVFCVIRPSWEAVSCAVGFMMLVNLPLWLRRGGA